MNIFKLLVVMIVVLLVSYIGFAYLVGVDTYCVAYNNLFDEQSPSECKISCIKMILGQIMSKINFLRAVI